MKVHENGESGHLLGRLSRTTGVIVLFLLLPLLLPAQSATEIGQILERLDRLEKQNQELMEEIRGLRSELAASRAEAKTVPALQDNVNVQERRLEEQAQTKVEASQRFPIRVTGMALFNTYLNSRPNEGTQYPTTAATAEGRSRGGATVRQTILGLDYRGPRTVWGGKVHGSLYMDFFGGSGQILDQALRIRTASVQVDWKSRSVLAGLEKPLFSPREPNSLAQVAISPLSGAGNLWLWIPQVRFEQDFHFGEQSDLRAQIGVVQTREQASYSTGYYPQDVEPARPGLEGRFELSHGAPGGRRIEIAPGFHTSVSHVADFSVPSNLFSLDWFARPWRKLEFTGAFFTGENVAHLGTGAIRQGFTVLGERNVRPVHSKGGWAQWTLVATPRLSFNFFGGQQDDRNADLLVGAIGKNQQYGANFFYRLAPNVIASFETSQVRTTYIGKGNLLNNHYDLALAYLF